MLQRVLVLAASLLLASPTWATIACYYTLVKDNCWAKYAVSVEVTDAISAKVLTTVTVPAGKTWTRVTFPCETNGQKLMYHARFSPSIWESEKGKVYPAKNFWSLPDHVNPGDSAWNVSVCYSADFSEVPLPPEATGTCKCDFSVVPEVPPKQL